MKPIKGGVDRISSANAGAMHRAIRGGEMAPYHECDLSGDATNTIKGTSWRNRPTNPRLQSRNQADQGPPSRGPDGRFKGNGG